MREIRPSGLEGGGPQLNAASLPLSNDFVVGGPSLCSPLALSVAIYFSSAVVDHRHLALADCFREHLRYGANSK